MKKHRIIRKNKMQVAWTNTSRIPDADIVEAIKFLCSLGVDIDKTVIHYKTAGRGWAWGYAYPRIPFQANLDGLRRHQWRNLITVNDHYSGNKKSDVIRMDRSIFNTLAHEAKHVEDFRHYGRDRRGVQWERKARAFAAWATEKWEARTPQSRDTARA